MRAHDRAVAIAGQALQVFREILHRRVAIARELSHRAHHDVLGLDRDVATKFETGGGRSAVLARARSPSFRGTGALP